MKNVDPKSQGELACCTPGLPLSITKLTLWAEDLSHIAADQKKTLVFALWFVCCACSSGQTPVTHQMTAMSISRDENGGGTEESIKAEEASSASSSSGR